MSWASASRMRFAGWVAGPAKFALLASARVVAVPSRFETFGIVALEAAATGAPVVAFDIDCLREVRARRVRAPGPPLRRRRLRRRPRRDLPRHGLRHGRRAERRTFARRFDWDAAAAAAGAGVPRRRGRPGRAAVTSVRDGRPVPPPGQQPPRRRAVPAPPARRRPGPRCPARRADSALPLGAAARPADRPGDHRHPAPSGAGITAAPPGRFPPGAVPPPTPAAVLPGPTGATVASATRALEWTLAGLVVLIALVVRATGLTSANDLFIDELTYADLAAMLAAGRLPALFGEPFFLHPPGGMLLDAATIRLLGLRGTPMDLVFEVRWVHAALGVLMVLLGYLVVRSVTTRVVAVLAGLVLALDPFLLRNDTRVMLETPMTAFLVGGLLGLLVAVAQPRRPGARPARGVRRPAAGLRGVHQGHVRRADRRAARPGLHACAAPSRPATVLRVASRRAAALRGLSGRRGPRRAAAGVVGRQDVRAAPDDRRGADHRVQHAERPEPRLPPAGAAQPVRHELRPARGLPRRRRARRLQPATPAAGSSASSRSVRVRSAGTRPRPARSRSSSATSSWCRPSSRRPSRRATCTSAAGCGGSSRRPRCCSSSPRPSSAGIARSAHDDGFRRVRAWMDDRAAAGRPGGPDRRDGRVRAAAAPGVRGLAVAALAGGQRRRVRRDAERDPVAGVRLRRARAAHLAGRPRAGPSSASPARPTARRSCGSSTATRRPGRGGPRACCFRRSRAGSREPRRRSGRAGALALVAGRSPRAPPLRAPRRSGRRWRSACSPRPATPERAATQARAGVRLAVLDIAWDRYEPRPGEFDDGYAADVRRQVTTCEHAGIAVVLGPGLQYPPGWVLGAARGHLPQPGRRDPGPARRRTWCSAAPCATAAAATCARLDADLGLERFRAVRIGTTPTGELGYPGPGPRARVLGLRRGGAGRRGPGRRHRAVAAARVDAGEPAWRGAPVTPTR